MADEQGFGEGAGANGADTSPQVGPQVGMITQYVKDVSFENPNAPAVFQWQGQPHIDVGFSINASTVGDEVHEVVLHVEVKARSADRTAFQIELAYAGLFGIRNVPEADMQPFLLAEAPRILFPFARRVVADLVRDGGFPPLLLEPIDFAALYAQQAEAQAAGMLDVQGQA